MCRHRKFGHSSLLIPLLRRSDPEYYFDYMRMFPATFEKLLSLVRSGIERLDTNWRMAISARTRLEITLRFLASGDTQRSLSFSYMIGRSTVSDVISETTQVIWETLKNKYVRCPRKPEEWRDIARGFEQRWNFPNLHCIDGKHVTVEAPCNTGSENFNYKGSFSKILMAVCDSAYKFLYVEVGRSGGESDGGVSEGVRFAKPLKQGSWVFLNRLQFQEEMLPLM
ncbi:hypothetical protein MTO96_052327 [Rhipicephalus appendiculatus]